MVYCTVCCMCNGATLNVLGPVSLKALIRPCLLMLQFCTHTYCECVHSYRIAMFHKVVVYFPTAISTLSMLCLSSYQ